jgi:hypothetical protein
MLSIGYRPGNNKFVSEPTDVICNVAGEKKVIIINGTTVVGVQAPVLIVRHCILLCIYAYKDTTDCHGKKNLGHDNPYMNAYLFSSVMTQGGHPKHMHC